SSPGPITIGDFNGDGKADVAVAEFNPGYLELVLLGNGDGTLQASKSSPITYFAYATTADVNGDGKLDLIISCCVNSLQCAVSFLPGNGDGTFGSPITLFSGGDGGPIAVADVNGDGNPDLIDEIDPTAAQVYLGNGSGTFSNAGSYLVQWATTNGFPLIDGSTIAVSDFNQDGKVDFALVGSVLLGNGDGTFQGVRMTVAPNTLGQFAIGDFDSNGTQDVAALSSPIPGNNLYIFRNNGFAVLSLSQTIPTPSTAVAIAKGDFNGDGNLDLLLATGSSTYGVVLGNGDGTFQTPLYYPLDTSGASSILVGDFNNDKKLDFAISLYSSQTFPLLLGNGDGTFQNAVDIYDGGGGPLLAGDFNNDGNLDIVAGSAILFGNGNGTFQAAVFPANLQGFEALFVADVNNDRKPDLISYSGQVALGNGDGTFIVLPSAVRNLVGAIGDVNGDGKIDLFVENTQSEQTGVQLGNGDGTFGPLINVPPKGSLSGQLTDMNGGGQLTDMNGDGKPDLVFPWGSTDSGGILTGGIGVLLNTTAAGFELFATALSPATIAAGGSTTSTVSVSSMFGFNGAVSLACSGLPSEASCTFSPATIANSSGTSKLTITTMAPSSTGMISPMEFQLGKKMSAGLALILTMGVVYVPKRRRFKHIRGLAAIVLMLGLFVGCGSGGSGSSPSGGSGTSAGTYSLTVTATPTGGTSQNVKLTLIVQ
ncbi:MAG: VCBS repeat-containing protein, partial [Terriglobales bacterium]